MTIPENRMAMMPDILIASANTYGEYINMNINAISNEGVFLKSIYLKSRALSKPNTHPMKADAKNMRQNFTIM